MLLYTSSLLLPTPDDAAQDVHRGVAGDRVRDGRAELVLPLHCRSRFILLLCSGKVSKAIKLGTEVINSNINPHH